ncbi:MAG: DUF3152 domain-containing protein, partial [Myxococcota bacterium]|nr:DUF3152 domain-containing protein [Myxococcota bacterium]
MSPPPTCLSFVLPLALCFALLIGCQASGSQTDADPEVPLPEAPEPEAAKPSADPVEEPADPGEKDALSTGLPMEQLPLKGPGRFIWASGQSDRVGRGKARKYSVGVEEGLDIDPDAVASLVDSTFADRRSWIADPRQGFQRVAEGGIKLVIATPKTVDRLCLPLKTRGEVSCAKNGYIPINLKRWEFAVEHWDSTLENYRRYVFNHEMGHY